MIATIAKDGPATMFIPCPECRGEGVAVYEYVSVRHFFNPFQSEERTCQKCGGACEIEVEADAEGT